MSAIPFVFLKNGPDGGARVPKYVPLFFRGNQIVSGIYPASIESYGRVPAEALPEKPSGRVILCP